MKIDNYEPWQAPPRPPKSFDDSQNGFAVARLVFIILLLLLLWLKS